MKKKTERKNGGKNMKWSQEGAKKDPPLCNELTTFGRTADWTLLFLVADVSLSRVPLLHSIGHKG